MEMCAAPAKGYMPPPEFEEDTRDSLVKPDLSDATELWLIQWPFNQGPDFDGQELTLELHNDGRLGSFKGSSGKDYVVSSAGPEPGATVFLSSGSESKIVGKISRRVALIHYAETDELNKGNSNFRQMYQKSGLSMMSSSRHFGTPSQGSMSRSGFKASSHSSRPKSSLPKVEGPSTPSKRRHADDLSISMGQHTHDSAITSSGSLQHSHQSKSNKKNKKEVR